MKILIGFIAGAIAAMLWLTYEPKPKSVLRVKGKDGGAKILVERPQDEDPKTRVLQ